MIPKSGDRFSEEIMLKQDMSEQVETTEAQPASAPDWQVLEGIDPDKAEFPMLSRVGEDRILVMRIGDGFRGVERSCPHQQRSLHDAYLQGGSTMIRCRWHNYVFRLSDGKAVNCPGYRLKVFEVKSENGALLARPAN
jgi:nitrite reductase/ring-hydroxylating ferredoxin subunit